MGIPSLIGATSWSWTLGIGISGLRVEYHIKVFIREDSSLAGVGINTPILGD
jgi:hypothetical protein